MGIIGVVERFAERDDRDRARKFDVVQRAEREARVGSLPPGELEHRGREVDAEHREPAASSAPAKMPEPHPRSTTVPVVMWAAASSSTTSRAVVGEATEAGIVDRGLFRAVEHRPSLAVEAQPGELVTLL